MSPGHPADFFFYHGESCRSDGDSVAQLFRVFELALQALCALRGRSDLRTPERDFAAFPAGGQQIVRALDR